MSRNKKSTNRLAALFEDRGIDPMTLVGNDHHQFKHRQTIYKHMNGTRNPDVRSLMIYAHALDVPFCELYRELTGRPFVIDSTCNNECSNAID